MFISGGDQCKGFSAVFRSGGTSDTMDVVLGVMRDVIIDDKRHIGDVDTSRDHIGSDEDRHLTIPEIQHHLVPLLLLEIGVHSARVNMERAQGAGEILDALLLAGEDDHLLKTVLRTDRRQTVITDRPLR